MSEIQNDAVACVHYTGTFPEDGEVFDSSEGRDPLTFLVGHRNMIPGFEEEMLGAKVGERRTFTLEPARAYGEREEANVVTFPRAEFAEVEAEVPLEVGMTLVAGMEDGPRPFTITEVRDDDVVADFNHQLAGRSLTFAVEVVDVRDATEDELAHGHAHGPGGHHH
jgi:FKBP-type peptidyl-prolyl cis-trans isomerase SlyD